MASPVVDKGWGGVGSRDFLWEPSGLGKIVTANREQNYKLVRV